MRIGDIKPGVRVRHIKSNGQYVVDAIGKIKHGGEWFTGVFYSPAIIHANESPMLYARAIDDFNANFETV